MKPIYAQGKSRLIKRMAKQRGLRVIEHKLSPMPDMSEFMGFGYRDMLGRGKTYTIKNVPFVPMVLSPNPLKLKSRVSFIRNDRPKGKWRVEAIFPQPDGRRMVSVRHPKNGSAFMVYESEVRA